MGGSLREPCTMIDLNHELYNCSTSNDRVRDLGMQIQNYTCRLDNIVTGYLHVDDLLVMSRAWRCDSICSKVGHMFPKDVGMAGEDRGPV